MPVYPYHFFNVAYPNPEVLAAGQLYHISSSRAATLLYTIGDINMWEAQERQLASAAAGPSEGYGWQQLPLFRSSFIMYTPSDRYHF